MSDTNIHKIMNAIQQGNATLGLSHAHHDIAACAGQILLLTGNGGNAGTATTEALEHNVVAHHVELLLDLSLHILIELLPIGTDGGTVQIVGLGALDDAIDLLAGISDGLQDRLQIADVVVLPAGNLEVALVGLELLFLLSGRRGWYRSERVAGEAGME